MKLEVGKTYLNRWGEEVRIESEDRHPLYPFNGDTGECYTACGEYIEGEQSGSDLMSEVADDLPAQINHAEEALKDDLARSTTSKYTRTVPSLEIDIYDVIVAWDIRCPARQHALKKIMCAGERGVKDVVQDLDEAIQALERAKELVK